MRMLYRHQWGSRNSVPVAVPTAHLLPALGVPALLSLTIAVPHLNDRTVLVLVWRVYIQALSSGAAQRTSLNTPLLRRRSVAIPDLNPTAILGLFRVLDIKALSVSGHQSAASANPSLLVFTIAVPKLHSSTILRSVWLMHVETLSRCALDADWPLDSAGMTTRHIASAAAKQCCADPVSTGRCTNHRCVTSL